MGPPEEDPERGNSLALLLLLLLVIGGLVCWAWLKNPPSTPNPAATADPADVQPR